jgi:hypothetical protein
MGVLLHLQKQQLVLGRKWEKDCGGSIKCAHRMHGTRDPMLQGNIMQIVQKFFVEDMDLGFQNTSKCTLPDKKFG